jgi:hypothetical protein
MENKTDKRRWLGWERLTQVCPTLYLRRKLTEGPDPNFFSRLVDHGEIRDQMVE